MNVGRTGTAAMAAAYDRIAYPSGFYAQTNPARIAAMARLHGLNPPEVASARVLELGGGDGLNLAALAAAYPDAHFLSLDVAPQPVARGKAMAAEMGLDNLRVEVGDVLDAAETLDGPFDYVIAHGLYAWVPEEVRRATMAAIGRVLAPDGVAFLSYNSKPGGQIRSLIREIALQAIGDEQDPVRRLAIARARLDAFANGPADEPHIVSGLREQARIIASRPDEVLGHDELGLCYHPQSVQEVEDAAAAVGLAYLNDVERNFLVDGFPRTGATDQASVVRAIQSADYDRVNFFRNSLLVRADRPIQRRLQPENARTLWMETPARHIEGRRFKVGDSEIEIGDDRMSAIMVEAGRSWPQRVHLAKLDLTHDQLDAFVRLWSAQVVRLYTGPLPATPAPSERPRASALARWQVARGEDRVARLDQSRMQILTPWLSALLPLLDGTRDVGEIDRLWRASPHAATIDSATALKETAQNALLVA